MVTTTDYTTTIQNTGKYDVFISHSSKDYNIAKFLYEALGKRSIRCWEPYKHISGGAEWINELANRY